MRKIDMRVAVRRALPTAVCVITPVALTVALYGRGGSAFAYDFHAAFRPAGNAVLHGASPYADPRSPAVMHDRAFVYPAFAALLLAPLALLTPTVGGHVIVLANIAAMLVALRALDVRDYRIYGLAFTCPAVVYAWHLGNLALPICLAVALMWRLRSRPAVVGLLFALIVTTKLYLWPLGFWLLGTRRHKALGIAAAASIAVNLSSWALIGYRQIGHYRELLAAVARHEEASGYSVFAVATHAGAGHFVAYASTALVGVVLAIRSSRVGGVAHDLRCLALAIGACIAATPILWIPYLSLLVVPLALARPVLSPAWLLLLVPWVCPQTNPNGWQVALVVASTTWILVITARPTSGPQSCPTLPQRRRADSSGLMSRVVTPRRTAELPSLKVR